MTKSFAPCFVIPVYDHSETLGPTLDVLAKFGILAIVVDDGSSQGHARIVETECAARDWITLLNHPVNRGKGAAVKTAIRQAAACGHSHAMQVDADLQHDLGQTELFLDAARRDPAAVILGVPEFDELMPTVRRYSRYITHAWVWINTLSLHIRDAMCGFRVYPVDTLNSLLDRVDVGDRMDFDIEIVVRLAWQDVRFVSLPVITRYPVEGRSHFRLVEDNVRISVMHARLFVGMLVRLPRLLAARLGGPA